MSAVLIWKTTKQTYALSLLLCSIFLFCHVDERRGLLSSPVTAPLSSLRVITWNWGGSGQQGLAQLIKLEPDIILLQEVPSKTVLQELAKATKLELLSSPEAAILARGPIRRLSQGVHHVKGLWEGRVLVSLRLSPPLMRFDIWSPNNWETYSSKRKERRESLEGILSRETPELVGGDFNVPAGDGALSPLKKLEFQDAFATAPRGSGNTAPSYLLLHRIDQLWCSSQYQVLQAFTTNIEGGDHKALVVDLKF